VPMAVNIFGNGISQPYALSGAIGERPELAGSASGLAGFIQFAICGILTVLVGRWLDTSPDPVIHILLGAIAIAIAAAWVALRAERAAQPAPR